MEAARGGGPRGCLYPLAPHPEDAHPGGIQDGEVSEAEEGAAVVPLSHVKAEKREEVPELPSE